MDAPKEEVKPEEQKPLELSILLHPDNTIEIKGSAYLNEPIAFWMLDKAKHMVENYHIGKMVEAAHNKQKIITQENKGLFKGFVNRVFK